MLRCRPLQHNGWNRCGPILDLRMAIRAQKRALASLSTQRVQRERAPPGIDLEALLLRRDVMEMKGPHVLRVTTDQAGAARLAHEDRLHPSTAARYGLGATATAPVIAPTVKHIHRFAVTR